MSNKQSSRGSSRPPKNSFKAPDVAMIQAWCNQANQFEAQAKIKEALQCLNKAQRVLPDHPEIMADRMRYHSLLDETEEAEQLLQRLPRQATPHLAQAINTLAVTYDTRGERQRALELFDQALSMHPAHAEIWNNKALCHLHANELPDSFACVLKAIEFEPERAVFYFNASKITGTMNRWNDARFFIIKALALQPENPDYWFQSYWCCCELRDYVYARSSMEQVIKFTPPEKQLKEWHGLIFQLDLFMAQWEDYEERCQALRASIHAGEVPLRPFTMLALPLSLQDQRTLLASYLGTEDYRVFSPFVAQDRGGDRIRIAYISSDLVGHHPVLHLCRGLLTRHDRSRFEVFVYATKSYPNEEDYHYVQNLVEHFTDITSLTLKQMLTRIRQDAPSIVVDLNGHTNSAREDLLAQRLAPIQINYIGFPGTMGSTFHDYILADSTVVPEVQAPLYSEKIVWLPGSFQINDDERIKPQFMLRSDAGIPDGVQVLASFNNTLKLNPKLFACWMRIMQQVPDSVLWLIANTEDIMARLRAHAAAHGVDGQRIYFAPHVRYPKHLNRLALADLVLDTLPFGGGASSSDALWCGVPVLTCLGDTFAGRMSASLLWTAGFPELVTPSLHVYEERAVGLLQHPEQRLALRARLQQAEVRTRLFDTASKIRSIEAGYIYMIERYRKGLPPASFTVHEDGSTEEGFVGVTN